MFITCAKAWLGQDAYIDATPRVHARVEDAILLPGCSACRMTLRGTVVNRTCATHPLAVVHVFFAAQKPSHGRPATGATLPGRRQVVDHPSTSTVRQNILVVRYLPQRTIRTGKDCGIAKYPSTSLAMNKTWQAAALTAATLLAWLELLALDPGLARAEPKTLRYRILHTAARLTRGARQRRLTIAAAWPWAADIITAWDRITALP